MLSHITVELRVNRFYEVPHLLFCYSALLKLFDFVLGHATAIECACIEGLENHISQKEDAKHATCGIEEHHRIEK